MKFVAVIPTTVTNMKRVDTEPLLLYPIEEMSGNSIVVLDTDDYEYDQHTDTYSTETLHKEDITFKHAFK